MEVAVCSPTPLDEAPFSLAVCKQALILATSQPMSVSLGGPQSKEFRTESQYVALCFLPSYPVQWRIKPLYICIALLALQGTFLSIVFCDAQKIRG